MTINRIGATANARPAEVQNTNETSRPESPRSPGHADLSPRVSNAPAASPPRVSRESVQDVHARMNEVNNLLASGGAAILEQGLRDGFQALPPQTRPLGLQTARLLGMGGELTPPSSPLSPTSLLQRLDLVSGTSEQLLRGANLDLAASVDQIRESTNLIAASLKATPTADLAANREAVKEKMSAWTNQTEALHEQLKAQAKAQGMTEKECDRDPVISAALHARTEAAYANMKTLARMGMHRMGRAAFDLTIGAVASTVRRFLGT